MIDHTYLLFNINMSHIGLERIQLLFQTWPDSFKLRFNRMLTKEEILKAITDRQKELEETELKRKFDEYSVEDLRLVRKFLDEKQIDNILTDVNAPKYKVFEEEIHKPKNEAQDISVKNINKSKKK